MFAQLFTRKGSALTPRSRRMKRSRRSRNEAIGSRRLSLEPLEVRSLLSIGLTNLAVGSPIEEGSVAYLTGNIVDPDISSPMTLRVDWADGSLADTQELDPGATSFAMTHPFLDNLPGNAPYTIAVTLATSGSVTTGGTWSNVASTPVLSFAGVGGIIDGSWYVASKYSGGDPTVLQVYNPATDTWIMKTADPVQRSNPAGGVIGGKLYVVAGFLNSDSNSSTNVLRIYDAETNTWAVGAPAGIARGSMAGAAIGQKLYVVGGVAGYGSANRPELEIYDSATNTWSFGAPMPSQREAIEAAVIDGKLYVVGGFVRDSTWTGGDSVGTLQIYDPATNTWTTAASMPTPRLDPAVAVIDGKLFVAGGWVPGRSNYVTPVVEVYDPAANTWSTAPSMLTPRWNAAGTAMGGKMYAAGGGTILNEATTNSVEVFTPGQETIAAAATLTVNNVAPTLSNLAVTPSINEGEVAHLTGNVTDPGTLDSFTLVVNWGDGSVPEIFALDAGTTSFDLTHQYLDDNPSGTASDTYTVTLTVTDDDGGVGSDTRVLNVQNVAPTGLNLALTAAMINEGQSTTLSGSFTDPGTLDNHTVVIDWGDNSTPTTLNLAAGVLRFGSAPATSHQYVHYGTYAVTVTVIDDDNGSASSNTSVLVNALPVAVNDAYSVPEDGAIVVAAPGVLGNDTDPDGDPLTVNVVPGSGPVHGALVLNSNGSFGYAPFADFHGTDSFVYQVADGRGGTSTATVTISVLTAQQQIDTLVAQVQALVGPGLPLNTGEGNSLTTKLDGAKSALDRGNANAGINKLEAFINEVNAKIKSKKLTSAQGQPLIDAANTAITSARSGASNARARVFASLGKTGLSDESWLNPLEQSVVDALVAAQG